VKIRVHPWLKTSVISVPFAVKNITPSGGLRRRAPVSKQGKNAEKFLQVVIPSRLERFLLHYSRQVAI
jgi:hypothetical protein